jgi:beta-N-acetylhexosaminidase
MKIKILPVFYTLVVIIGLSSCHSTKTTSHNTPLTATIHIDFTSKDQSWKSLSLREKIGQTMIIRAFHDDQVKQYGSIQNMLDQYPVGGIYVPWWDFLYKQPRDSVIYKVKKAVAAYENASKYPLIITEDFERGVGNVYAEYTDMPVEMALGATQRTDLAYRYGNAIAKEAHTIGVNWLLHPLGDLNMNPLQDLIVERAISDDAHWAYPLLKSQIQGMKAHGTVATLKHFPGDGTTIKNQHLVTSANNLSMEEWNQSFGMIYQKMINDSIACIMVGHIRFPAYQTKKIKGVFPPATLSDELLVELLKNKMNFNGVVMSDALNMGGAAGYYQNELETAVQAFKSGVDLVLWPSLAYMDEIEKRIISGEIPMSRLDDAVERIWGVREKFDLIKRKIFFTIYHQMKLKKLKIQPMKLLKMR